MVNCSNQPLRIKRYFIATVFMSGQSYLQYHKRGEVEDHRQREKQPDGVPDRLEQVHEQAREELGHPRREGADVDGPDDPCGIVGLATGLDPADDGGGQICG